MAEVYDAEEAVLPLAEDRPAACLAIGYPYLSGWDVVLLQEFVVLTVAEDVDHLDDVLLVDEGVAGVADWLLADERKMRSDLLFLLGA